MKGLDWSSVPVLGSNFKTTPKKEAVVVLESPAGNPVLTVWQLGKGRAALSSSIFANDEVSSKFGDWKDFGKYYANVFRWLGGNSTAKKAILKDKAGEVTIDVDFNKTTNTVSASLFGLHGAHDCPGFTPLQGLALENYKALNLRGALGRFDISCATARGEYDFTRTDRNLKLLEELELIPVALFNGFQGGQSWVWADGSSWYNPSEQAIADIIDEIDAFLKYTNGTKGTPEYRLRVPYIELLNEPDLTARTIKGFAKLLNSVADHVHANFPGVKIGAFGFFETPYLEQFIDECGANIDWIARHPYGWTGEMLFSLQDRFEAYARSKGHDHIKFFVNEWDFWIMGRQKFDYMMKRNFEAVKRSESLLGTLHYRLGMYNEAGEVLKYMNDGKLDKRIKIPNAYALSNCLRAGKDMIAVVARQGRIRDGGVREGGTEEIVLIDAASGEIANRIPLSVPVAACQDLDVDSRGNFLLHAAETAELFKFAPSGELFTAIGAGRRMQDQDGSVLNHAVAVDSKDNVYSITPGNPGNIVMFDPDFMTARMRGGGFDWFDAWVYVQDASMALDGKDRIWVVSNGNVQPNQRHLLDFDVQCLDDSNQWITVKELRTPIPVSEFADAPYSKVYSWIDDTNAFVVRFDKPVKASQFRLVILKTTAGLIANDPVARDGKDMPTVVDLREIEIYTTAL
ncbi:MAG: hypothetical protein FWH27_05085 [Planctomycetaceae bacterium]|nr:hypothetical protein [Planctomycetaceae bacterium]